MIRNYEGTMRLQGIGVVEGITAKNIKVGDVLVWNYGGTSTVVAFEFSKTGKTLKVTTEADGELYERKLSAERIVCVKELNSAEEVVEEVEAEEEVEIIEIKEIEALDLTNTNFNNMYHLKEMVSNWEELPEYIKDFIESSTSFYMFDYELIIYMGRKAVASASFYNKNKNKIVIDSIGAGQLFQWKR